MDLSQNKKAITFLPTVVALELTYRCNHKCLFCSCPWEADNTYISSEMSANEWEKAIDVLIEYGVSSFTLTGGEPLMRDEIKTIIDVILARGVSLNLISNGKKIDN